MNLICRSEYRRFYSNNKINVTQRQILNQLHVGKLSKQTGFNDHHFERKKNVLTSHLAFIIVNVSLLVINKLYKKF